MADSAIELNDKNGDEVLDAKELAAAPGLKAAVDREGQNSADLNGDGKLSRDEIRDRIKLFEDSALGIQLFAVTIVLDRRPLAGAKVVFEPEPFLEGVLPSASDETRQDGTARPQVEIEDMKGLPPGMYRLRVTHPSRPIPARYNENTTLGVDLAPDTSGYSSGDRFVFLLESK